MHSLALNQKKHSILAANFKNRHRCLTSQFYGIYYTLSFSHTLAPPSINSLVSPRLPSLAAKNRAVCWVDCTSKVQTNNIDHPFAIVKFTDIVGNRSFKKGMSYWLLMWWTRVTWIICVMQQNSDIKIYHNFINYQEWKWITLSWILTSAFPWCTSSWTISVWPCLTARIRAVRPS